MPRRRRPSHCLPFCAPIRPRHRPIVQWRPTGGTVIPRSIVRGPISHCASPVALVCSPPGRFATFQACHHPLCRSIDGVLVSGPASDRPPPPSCPHWRSNSDHEVRTRVKSTVSTETWECDFPGINIPNRKRRQSKTNGWLGSRVVSVLDTGAEGPGFKSQSRRCRVTVLGKLFTPTVPLFTKQQNW